MRIETDMAPMIVDAFGLTDGLSRPGSRHLHSGHKTTDHAVQVTREAMVDEARRDSIRELSDAWRTPATPPAEPASKVTGYGSGQPRGQKPGDACAIDGFPGHLNDKLVCEPVERQDGLDARDEAYRQMCDQLVNAWRRP